MRRTDWLQETRIMRLRRPTRLASRLPQEEAALLLGVCERTFRRYMIATRRMACTG